MKKSANIAKFVFELWEKCPGELIFSDGSRNITREQFIQKTLTEAVDLKQTVNPGDSVLLVAGRGVDYFIDMFAIWSIGAVAVPLAADASDDYIDFIINIAGPVACCGPTDIEELVIDAKNQTNADEFFKFYEAQPEDCCTILFTSGSTGTPKGVVLSNQSILGNSQGILEALQFETERLFVNTPFHFTSAICHFLACCLSRSCFVGVEEKYMLARLPEEIVKNKISVFGGAPVQIRWIADYMLAYNEQGKNHNLDLKAVMSSGDHLADDIVEKMETASIKTKIFTVYGLTELGGRFCILSPNDLKDRKGSVGKPITGLHVEIRDADNLDLLPVGQIGLVIASGSLLFDKYLENEANTKRSLSDFGFNTGDLGYLDEDGFLYLSGRSDDVFKVNGKKVSSLLIAQELMRLNLFQDVAVTPFESDIYGVIPKAYLVMKEGVSFAKGSVLRELRKKLALNHLPKEFQEVQRIPRTGSGKIQKHLLG